MAENKPDTSRRAKHLERMRKKHPDKKFEDEEEIFGQISDDYDQLEQENTTMREHEQDFSDLFSSNPRSARLMMEWKDGKDPVSALVRIYGKDEILAAIEDPARLEAIEKANMDFAERVSKEKEYKAQYEKNFRESAEAVDAWAQEQGISEADIDRIGTALAEICSNFIVGRFTPETFQMVMKAQSYDADVANARDEGTIAGKNTKIRENLRRSQKSDGIQSLGGRNGTASQGSRKPKSVFDLASEAD